MQSIYLEDRKKLVVMGAKKIISSTETQAVVEILQDALVVSGIDLEITKLDLEAGEVDFSGTINNIKFTQKAEKKNLFKRLFK